MNCMIKVFPSYYNDFKCIAGRCKHNCCIGWEIDIDEEKRSYYQGLNGEIAERIKQNVSYEETPHFVLTENERCPFLNAENLCDLIIALGEDALCDICREHPRFYNELPDRIEGGLGLCCEEACRIILEKKDKTELIQKTEDGHVVPAPPSDDPLLNERSILISTAQDRTKPFLQRMEELCSKLGIAALPFDSVGYGAELYKLERMDDSWSTTLNVLLKANRPYEKKDRLAFEKAVSRIDYAFEQFFIYLIYRYYACAYDTEDAIARTLFALQSTILLYDLSYISWIKSGEIAVSDVEKFARQFSCEIEYSEENICALFDLFYEFV